MYIGIDLGTSSVKGLLVSKDGLIKKMVTKEYPLVILNSTWCEQDPNLWLKNCLECLKEIVKGYESDILGISFSGQMHGLVLLDEKDLVIRNAILWNDQRTTKEVEYLNVQIGKEKLMEYTGNIALTGLTAPKILWVKNNEPLLFKQISKIMLPKDYLIYKLTNEFVTDVSDASGTLYFDVSKKQYSDEMLTILSIKKNQLPRICESSEVIGKLSLEFTSLLNLSNDVLVIAGAGDQAAGAIGIGTIKENDCNISLGTSGVVLVAKENFKKDEVSYLQSYAHANGKYLMMGVMLNAAGSLKWWNEFIFKKQSYDDFFDEINQSNIHNDLYFLPYLNGERSPINDSFVRGAFIGLHLTNTKYDLNRAIIEGVCFALKQTYDLLSNKNIRLTGGGAKSPVWAQMIADIFNKEVTTIIVEEGPAYGAAILAMVGCREYKDVFTACQKIIKIKNVYYPNMSNNVIYTKKYQRYLKIYPTIKQLFY